MCAAAQWSKLYCLLHLNLYLRTAKALARMLSQAQSCDKEPFHTTELTLILSRIIVVAFASFPVLYRPSGVAETPIKYLDQSLA